MKEPLKERRWSRKQEEIRDKGYVAKKKHHIKRKNTIKTRIKLMGSGGRKEKKISQIILYAMDIYGRQPTWRPCYERGIVFLTKNST